MTQSDSLSSWNDYLELLPAFEDKLLNVLNKLSILDSCKTFSMDHACIRFSTAKQVDALRQDLKNLGKEISSAQVNGREIVIFQFDQPLRILNWQVEALELPYPKENHNFADGWEHVEFVLPDVENSIEALGYEVRQLLLEQDLNRLNYKEDAPHVVGEQLANPTSAIKLDGIGIKFHTNSIQDVVRSG